MRIVLLSVVIFLAWVVPSEQAAAQSQVELDFLHLINQYRAQSAQCWTGQQMAPWDGAASQTLALSPKLSQAAKSHNLAMIHTNCTQHTCPGEAHLVQRVEAFGYTQWNFLSENIAGGFETAQHVFEVWQQSGGHNRNMLSCRARAIGISMVYDPNSMAWWYWTTDFGDFIDGNVAAPTPAPSPTSQLTLPELLDTNGNHIIGDNEVVDAIAMWVTGAPIPGSQATIDDRAIQTIITLWVTGERF